MTFTFQFAVILGAIFALLVAVLGISMGIRQRRQLGMIIVAIMMAFIGFIGSLFCVVYAVSFSAEEARKTTDSGEVYALFIFIIIVFIYIANEILSNKND
jgi:NADH:ubiquinone oxidoreductase subunit 2 (subunit N)